MAVAKNDRNEMRHSIEVIEKPTFLIRTSVPADCREPQAMAGLERTITTAESKETNALCKTRNRGLDVRVFEEEIQAVDRSPDRGST